MSNEGTIETVTIRGKKYIDMAGLSLYLRNAAKTTKNENEKNYMNHLSDELLRMLATNGEEK
jgi:hypothetical protein